MRINIEKGLVLPPEILQAKNEDAVFEHISGAPRVEAVAVTEHSPSIR
jgi:hypothetical protein